MNREGLPHSEIFGSKPVCGSPKLIAACHVLHRLLAPRHSPYALSSLTIKTLELTSAGFRLLTTGFGTHVPEPGACGPESACVSPVAHCVCVVGKLPFAGYSVVKERARLRQGFGGQPSLPRRPELQRLAGCSPPIADAPAGEGWWRIPGSNR